MPQLEQEGWYRAFPIESGLKKGTKDGSKSLAASFKFRIQEYWYGDGGADPEWCDYSEYGMEVDGAFWFRKADGTANEQAVKSLAAAFGWNGAPSFFDSQDLTGKGVVIQVKAEEYEGKRKFKANWLEHWDHVPKSGVSNVSETEAKQLDIECGAVYRALIAASGGTKSAAAPAAPPPPGKKSAAPAPVGAAVADGEQVPF